MDPDLLPTELLHMEAVAAAALVHLELPEHLVLEGLVVLDLLFLSQEHQSPMLVAVVVVHIQVAEDCLQRVLGDLEEGVPEEQHH